ncbi:Uncharacterised protein [Vibrio cholerae]|uniref:Uncharacterized protein n=1 Tax=Vibrio cholerae TaxID=666 RepID=A0A655XLD7_VIBCL|nr:Uncharacterised protein [Vibrio cholerae]CSA74320.1 Uncharacterised protein [Vibrio cholerae]CSB47280.1 Uncharacterised protein [Vibrio cholerae]CSB54291.1 Uncharacterised protein [Vibrio cholerae]CSC17723.1 Uncharacterised protein [Vibrio cholerae]
MHHQHTQRSAQKGVTAKLARGRKCQQYRQINKRGIREGVDHAREISQSRIGINQRLTFNKQSRGSQYVEQSHQ